MDIHSVKISKDEIDLEIAKSQPATATSVYEDACDAYRRVRPAYEIVATIIGGMYPPGAIALATVKVILDKACAQDEK